MDRHDWRDVKYEAKLFVVSLPALLIAAMGITVLFVPLIHPAYGVLLIGGAFGLQHWLLRVFESWILP